jgi:DNA-binding IclR family transcriptional regulator
VVNSTARLQASLGGSLLSLHARAAREVLGAFEPKDARRVLARHERDRPALTRQRLSDAQVKAFIKRSKASGYSTALRELRDAGLACEQARFRALYQEAKG